MSQPLLCRAALRDIVAQGDGLAQALHKVPVMFFQEDFSVERYVDSSLLSDVQALSHTQLSASQSQTYLQTRRSRRTQAVLRGGQ